MKQEGRKTSLLNALKHALLGALVWAACTGADPDGWWLGLPAIVLYVALVPRPVQGQPSVCFRSLPRFLSYFVFQSIKGGLDVAWRALRPGFHISPGYLRYEPKLPQGLPLTFYANTVSLLPGTLSCNLQDSVVEVHVLTTGEDATREMQRLEAEVSRLYGLQKRGSS